MGPGYVPRALSYILMGLGSIVCVFALVSGSEPVEAPKWKPITLVTIGIVCFALLFERAGMLPALVALVRSPPSPARNSSSSRCSATWSC